MGALSDPESSSNEIQACICEIWISPKNDLTNQTRYAIIIWSISGCGTVWYVRVFLTKRFRAMGRRFEFPEN